MTFHSNNIFFQKKQKILKFFSLNTDILSQFSVETERIKIEERIIEIYDTLFNLLKVTLQLN